MKSRIRRFLTDPHYPDAYERKKLRRAVASALGIAAAVVVVAFYTIGPILVLVGGALAQKDLAALTPIVVRTREDADTVIGFHALLVSWRWVFLCLCAPLAWAAARGRVLWARLLAAVVVTFICACLYFEALKSNHKLEALDRQWSGTLSDDASHKLGELLFWFEGWQIGFSAIGLGIMASLVAALMTEREKA